MDANEMPFDVVPHEVLTKILRYAIGRNLSRLYKMVLICKTTYYLIFSHILETMKAISFSGLHLCNYHLAGFSHLECIDLFGTSVDNDGLYYLRNCRRVRISFCDLVDDIGIPYLARVED